MNLGAPARVERFNVTKQGSEIFAVALLLLVLLLVGLPLVTVILMTFRTGLPGEASTLTLINYQQAFSDPLTYDALLNTVLFATGTVAITFLFAIPITWLMNRTDVPLKGAVHVLMVVGILIPVFLRTIGWILLLSPRIGLINQLAARFLGFDQPIVSPYNIPVMAFIQGISFVPVAFFMLSAPYKAMDPSLEEAAYASGASKLRTFLWINLPLTLPATAAAVVYLFVLSFGVFEVPAIIGLPSKIFVLSSRIYIATQGYAGLLPDYGLAGAYGTIMLLVGIGAGYLYLRVIREGKKFEVITGKGYRPRIVELGHWKPPAVAFVIAYFCLQVFMPLVILVWASLLPYFQVPSPQAFASISLKAYSTIPAYVRTQSMVNTLLLMFAVPSGAMIISVLVSWVVVRTQVRFRGVLDILTFLPHAVPHILFAVGVGYLSLLYRGVIPIYGTIFAIMLAHVVAYLSFGTRCTNSAIIQVHRELEEAGKVCGASTPRVLGRIVLPLMAGAVFNSWIWIAILSYREVTMAVILYTRQSEVLSTLIWQFWVSVWIPQVAALGVVLITCAMVIVGTLRFVFRRIGQYEAAG